MSDKDPLTEPVLVLNVNFEPLQVSSTKRVLGLLLAGKAELVLNGRGYIRTSQAEYEMPSIVRLSTLVRRPYPRIPLTKREVLRRDEYTCQYCGSKAKTLTIDHVLPRHAGGRTSWQNLVAACSACNRRKGGRTPEQAHMPLHRTPREPKADAMNRFGRYLPTCTEWEPFLSGW